MLQKQANRVARMVAALLVLSLSSSGMAEEMSSDARAELLVANAVTIYAVGAKDEANGWGVIVGKNQKGELYVVTANHNVRARPDLNDPDGEYTIPRKVSVGLYDGTTVDGALLKGYLPRPEDLAVVRIGPQPNLKWSIIGQGSLSKDSRGLAVHPIGNTSREWVIPLQGGNVVDVCARDCLVLFDKVLVDYGMSGQPLVSGDGIVAIVLSQVSSGGPKSSSPRGLAIDVIRKQLLAWGMPWSLVSAEGYKALVADLFAAVAKPDLKRVTAIVEKGVDASVEDEDGLTTLFYAARAGNMDMTRYLFAQGVRDERALRAAATGNYVAVGQLH